MALTLGSTQEGAGRQVKLQGNKCRLGALPVLGVANTEAFGAEESNPSLSLLVPVGLPFATHTRMPLRV